MSQAPPADRPPTDPGTDEADEEQLTLAAAQGEAYRDAALHMIESVAQNGATRAAGEYVVGYAIEEAEGMHRMEDGALRWREPEEENLHIEVIVMDGADDRFVPCLDVTVTVLAEDGDEVGTHRQPMVWHPMLLHYGRNWRVPGDGTYTLRIRIEPPAFPRHDEVNGRRFTDAVELSFEDVEVETGQD